MSDINPKADDQELDIRASQDRLAEAFEAEAIAEAGEAEDAEDAGLGENNDAEPVENITQPTDEDANTVVALNDEVDLDQTDRPNPFAIEAALQLAVRKVEALLFASPKPLSEADISERVPGADIEAVIERLEAHYADRGVVLRLVDNKWQFVTALDVADVLVEHRTQAKKLSRAALETLAIIAYHQPSSRADIEEVRGVAVAKGSLDQLLELGWIRLRGRRDAPGRPVLYGTSPTFLEHFGLADVSHLPGMADLKAAGLLDARLPPDFQVPSPINDDPDNGEDIDLLEANTDFSTDFHDAEDSPESELNDEENVPDENPSGAFPDADDAPFE